MIFAHIVSLQSIITIQYNYTTSKGLYSKCSGLCTIFSNHYAYTVGKLSGSHSMGKIECRKRWKAFEVADFNSLKINPQKYYVENI